MPSSLTCITNSSSSSLCFSPRPPAKVRETASKNIIKICFFLTSTSPFLFLGFQKKQIFIHRISESFFLHIDHNISPDSFFALFIQDLVAHSRIKLAFYIQISRTSHRMDCPGKLTDIAKARILGSADKKYRHSWIFAAPFMDIIGFFHKVKKCYVRIVCKSKSAQFGICVRLIDRRI